jgi:hypothetical protein
VETITRPMELVDTVWHESFGPRRLVFTLLEASSLRALQSG